MSRRGRVVIVLGAVIAALVALGGMRWWETYEHQQASTSSFLDVVQRGQDADVAFVNKAQKWADTLKINGSESMRARAKADLMAAARDSHARSLVVQHDLATLHVKAGTALAAARDAYRAHLEARIAQYAGWETDLGDRSHEADVEATRTIAQRAIADLSLSPPDRVRADALLR